MARPVASPATVAVAHELNHQVRQAMMHVRVPEHQGVQDWHGIGPELMRLLNKLHDEARQDLGVGTDGSAVASRRYW